MARQFGERLEWREIQTNPKRYAEYLYEQVSNYASRYASRADRDRNKAYSDEDRFSQEMAHQLEIANTIFERSNAGENVDESLVHFVAKTAEIHREFMGTNLRYNNDFYHEHTSLALNLQGNLPLRLQAKALEMIKSGEIYDYMREEDKVELQRRVAKSKNNRSAS